MRDAKHYRNMIDSNPCAAIGFSLAANAVYATRHGVCEPEHRNEEWQTIARDLKRRYGETLTTEQVQEEMDKEKSPAKENQ